MAEEIDTPFDENASIGVTSAAAATRSSVVGKVVFIFSEGYCYESMIT